jgi:hypothetical protein
MSHLTILPTVLHDADRLAASLEGLGLQPIRGGELRGFQESEPVELRVELDAGLALGWRRQPDGSLALVGDLQRLSRSRALQRLLARITHAYAARQALEDAALRLPEALVHFHA